MISFKGGGRDYCVIHSGGLAQKAKPASLASFFYAPSKSFKSYGLDDFLGHKKSLHESEGFAFCDPEGIRTPDPQIRNLLLYPTELRDHVKKKGSHS